MNADATRLRTRYPGEPLGCVKDWICPWCLSHLTLEGEDKLACCPEHGVVEGYLDAIRKEREPCE
jgi:hypothetical protein